MELKESTSIKLKRETNINFVNNTNKKLDWLLNHYFEPSGNIAQFSMLEAVLILTIVDGNIFTKEELPELRQKLIDDGYLKELGFFDGVTVYDLTIKGKLFWNNKIGGYVNKASKEAYIEKRDFLVSLSIAIGTCGIVIIEIIKALYKLNSTN